MDDDIVVFDHERDEITVGDLREWHYIEVTCAACGRLGRICPTRLWRRYPMETRVADLAHHFRCRRCRARGSRRWHTTHEMPIARRRKGDRRNELAIARWGLIPHWAKDAKIAYSTINARSETAANKPAFREAFKSRRALIPADGYFEWVRDGKEKQPYLIRMKDSGPFAFAGLWSTWQSPEGEVTSYTIMTTEPNELMAEIHNRMPVILGEDDHDRWLDLGADPDDVLKPCPANWLEAYPVDKRVGNVRNNDPGLIEPLSS